LTGPRGKDGTTWCDQEELAKRDLTESQELLVVMAVMVKRERGENQA